MAQAQTKILLTGDDLLKMSEEATEGYELIEKQRAAAVDNRVKLIAAAKAETAAKFAAEKQALAEQAAAGRATIASQAEEIADRIAGSILKG